MDGGSDKLLERRATSDGVTRRLEHGVARRSKWTKVNAFCYHRTMARGTAKKPYMTADGKHFETREKAVQHIFKIQTGRSDWTDYIYLGGSPRWRVYENGAIEEVSAGATRPHSTARNLPVTPRSSASKRAEVAYSDYSTNELRREIQTLEGELEMAGGRGGGLADRLDAARVALALRSSEANASKARRAHAVKKQRANPVECKVTASIRLSGAPAAMQTREFKHRSDAQTWLDQQREIADRRGWGGYKFELTEQCEINKGR